MYKVCSKCDRLKSVNQFYKRSASADGYQARCKRCSSENATEWSRKNYTSDFGRTKHLKKYGLTPAEYDAMLDIQQGKCLTCGRADVKLNVDHCHTTNKVRGLLCNGCNTALGLVKEDITVLNNLIQYINGV